MRDWTRWLWAIAALAFLALPTAVAAGTDLVAEATSGTETVANIPFKFAADPFDLRELPLTARPFSASAVVPREDNGVHDSHGVRMRVVRGKMYDFPRGQASYGLDNLNSYRLTQDTFYLDRALVQAERLVAYHDEGGGAWYYPNYPSKHRHGQAGEFIAAPYYSALPQGRILLFFSRLAEMTGEPRWREAADRTFAAFLRPGPCAGPYILNIDSEGYYWLQEWPWTGMTPDCTLNGHNSSLFGLFEYYTVTRDERARELFRGAVTTVRHYLPSFRRTRWISCYCLAHRSTNANYHRMHVGQLLELFKLTGSTVFARAADRFQSDYPSPEVAGAIQVEPGRYSALRFNADDGVSARRTVTIRRASRLGVQLRQRHRGRSEIDLLVAGGRLDGWWLAESPGRVYLRGFAAQVGYDPARTLTLSRGQTCTAYAYEDDGSVRESVRVDAGDGLTLEVGRRAVVNGVDQVRVRDGEFNGYWLPLRRGIVLR